MRCKTFFEGQQCPRCEFQQNRRDTAWRRRYFPFRLGAREKSGDGEVRQVQPPYRATDPCE